MFTSSESTGGRGRRCGGRGGDAKTLISPNTSFGDIINPIVANNDHLISILVNFSYELGVNNDQIGLYGLNV